MAIKLAARWLSMLSTMAALAGCAALPPRATAEKPAPDIGSHTVVRIVADPAQPRVGDTVRVRALVVNRGQEMVRVRFFPCTGRSRFVSDLPIEPTVAPKDTAGLLQLDGVVCLAASAEAQIAPGDSAFIDQAAWGPLSRAGLYSVQFSPSLCQLQATRFLLTLAIRVGAGKMVAQPDASRR
jgi:hypothetical protein